MSLNPYRDLELHLFLNSLYTHLEEFSDLSGIWLNHLSSNCFYSYVLKVKELLVYAKRVRVSISNTTFEGWLVNNFCIN